MNNFYKLPDVQNGFELLDDKFGWFSVLLPEESTNLYANPSFENSISGINYDNATLARVSSKQRRGIYSLEATPNTSDACIVLFDPGIATLANEWYTYSLDVFADPGEVFEIGFWSDTFVPIGSVTRFRGTGFWQRVDVKYFETQSSTRYLVIVKMAGSTNPFYVDGVQCENKPYATTYIDGDQKGYLANQKPYLWNGTPHSSTSTRIFDTGAGGKEVKLIDLGLHLIAAVGLGLFTVNNISTPIAVGGAYYQRSIPQIREFSLVGAVAENTFQGLQRTRKKLYDAMNPFRTVINQPLTLRYHKTDIAGNEQGVYNIPAVYKSGLEGSIDNPSQERIALGYQMFLPYISVEGESAAAGSIASVETETPSGYPIVFASIENQFGMAFDVSEALNTDYGYAIFEDVTTEGVIYFGGGDTGNGYVYKKYLNESFTKVGLSFNGPIFGFAQSSGGDLFAVGSFTKINGGATTAYMVAKWNGSAWEAVGSPTSINRVIYTAYYDNTHSRLYIGGYFSTPDEGLAYYDFNTSSWVAFATVRNVSGTGRIYDIKPYGNYGILVGGDFNKIEDISLNNIALFDGSNWTALGSGVDDEVYKMMISGSDIYAVGSFLNAGGSSAKLIAKYSSSAWSSVGGSNFNTDETSLRDIGIDDNGYIYVVGTIKYDNNYVYNGIAVFDKISWKPYTSVSSGGAYALLIMGDAKYVGVLASYAIVGGYPANRIAKYDGISWDGLGVLPSERVNTGIIRAIAVSPSGEIVVGGQFDTMGGISAFNIAKYSNGSWSAFGTGLTGGLDNLGVTALKYDSSGNLYVSGVFTSANDVTVYHIAKWNGTTFEPVGGSINGDFINDFDFDADGNLYIAGDFTTINGESIRYAAKFIDGAWSSLDPQLDNYAYAVKYNPVSNKVIFGGVFSTTGGGETNISGIATWSGSLWESMGTIRGCASLFVDPSNGYVYQVGGQIDGVNTISYWDGSAWNLISNVTAEHYGSDGIKFSQMFSSYNGKIYAFIDDGIYSVKLNQMEVLYKTGPIYSMLFDAYGNIFVGGAKSVAPSKASITSITVDGDMAYPTFIFTGPMTVTRITNFSTNESIAFSNFVLSAGEKATLSFGQYGITFTRADGTNLVSKISKPATIHLKTGENKIVTMVSDAGSGHEVIVKHADMMLHLP